MVNHELKATDPDPAVTAARVAALGASDQGVLVQRDTYFASRHGRLKLREQDGSGAELIAYRRSDSAEAEASEYTRAEAADGAALPKRAGVLTPAAAMGRVLINRLVAAGMTFSVE